MQNLKLIYLPNRMLLYNGPASLVIEHHHHFYIPWKYVNHQLLWLPSHQQKTMLTWQSGIVQNGLFQHKESNKKSPSFMRGKIPNPLFPLSYNRLIISKQIPGILFESLTPDSDGHQPISWIENDLRAPVGDVRLSRIIKEEFELLDHRPEEHSTLYKHYKNSRLFQFLNLPEETHQGHVFQPEWVFCEVTHPQWAYSYLYHRERKKRGHAHVDPAEYLQMLEENPLGKNCQIENCSSKSIKHSNLCKRHHYEAVMGSLPES